MNSPYIISILLGMITSGTAMLLNRIIRRKTEEMTIWSGWQVAITVRMVGLFLSGFLLYYYLTTNFQLETHAAISYFILFVTIAVGMVSDLFISILSIQEKNDAGAP